ncbi:uncharacterized protein CANTADRAFT_307394 [Suhomyces tanzawaensis NRRL Y-17324]|uniref:Uncharacterized protein n=1 Tax=Suhomyces tanzawaensis NRRL Y-17324 TaxID=984487 RepID=A0A1E4SCX2_9ASCO|nr:uncharacterized protein CANTADRAFT_307394 [Suhomyces tanzawaensis NRRL Y-17324]ODV77359.1 hypothetical protein CANTADRAFT_307394 [Suhomyces tanzawaensis NRRL Y-17324]
MGSSVVCDLKDYAIDGLAYLSLIIWTRCFVGHESVVSRLSEPSRSTMRSHLQLPAHWWTTGSPLNGTMCAWQLCTANGEGYSSVMDISACDANEPHSYKSEGSSAMGKLH